MTRPAQCYSSIVSTLAIIRGNRRIYCYLVAHLLDAGNTTGGLRSREFLFFGRNLAGKISRAVSNRDFDASYRTVVDGLVYFEFQFFRCDRRIVIGGGLSLLPGFGHCHLIGRGCTAFRFKTACFSWRRWRLAGVLYFSTGY